MKKVAIHKKHNAMPKTQRSRANQMKEERHTTKALLQKRKRQKKNKKWREEEGERDECKKL